MTTQVELSKEDFGSWLCQNEVKVVGSPGTWFHSPLAWYLFERTGKVYGIDDRSYGLASCDVYRWNWLPEWARLFVAALEKCAYQPMTGSEAFEVLARVELRLSSMAKL